MQYYDKITTLFIMSFSFITQSPHHVLAQWFTLTAPLFNLGSLGLSVKRAAALWTWVV